MNSIISSKEFQNFTQKGVTISFLKSDITKLSNLNVDCIVNCTGSKFDHIGGVSKAITEAAGPLINYEYESFLAKNKYLDFGIVHETPGFNLLCRILHVRTPGKHHKNFLGMTYTNLFYRCFLDMNLNSIALPLIGTGIVGMSLEDSLNFLKDSLSSIKIEKNVNIYVVNNNQNQIDECVKLVEKFVNIQPSSSNSILLSNAENCPICLEQINNPKKLDVCQHIFCTDCINKSFAIKKICPLCQTVYGIGQGNQPDGNMSVRFLNMTLPGYDRSVNTIAIVYSFPSGIQGPDHPNPGKAYTGTERTAYLPNNQDGKKVLDLLKKAFENKLLFTIGQSRTTGQNDTVTWNDIHHKTNINGGPTNFGYPDPGYIQRVIQELASKGIK